MVKLLHGDSIEALSRSIANGWMLDVDLHPTDFVVAEIGAGDE